MKLLLISVFYIALNSLAWAADSAIVNPHGSSPHGSAAAVIDISDIKVEKAVGKNAYTVAEIFDQSSSLKDQSIIVRGKVVKFSPEIMDKNWVHLRDGTGSAANKNNDLVVTMKGAAKVGSVVTIKGIVRVNKDFGHGYSYVVLVEDAAIVQ